MDFAQTDLPLFSQPPRNACEAGKQDGMNRVETNAGQAWNQEARKGLKQIAKSNEYFTSDPLWDALEDQGIPEPENPRAMGPVMLRGQREGWMTKVGVPDETRAALEKSRRPQSHMRPCTVYRSLIFAPAVVPPTQPEPEYDPEELF